ncbi:hypothetical protein C3B51_07400 [Pseudoalteromonas rubra]|uniref:Uncharacterized protein n=1 Tax=Pseudoalteromonas rubra TaxID=43658 RepID=A0A4Q7EJ49_9GAMM|nr:hypothetical protein C3B51_07400 [Pseudoalteromonas rubra]
MLYGMNSLRKNIKKHNNQNVNKFLLELFMRVPNLEQRINLTQFRALKREIKLLATRYWLGLILTRLRLNSLNQLSALIEKRKIGNCSASFLYKKWNESPVGSMTKIQLLDNLVPGASGCLLNPLWSLLNNPEQCVKNIDSFLYSLDPRVTCKILEPNTDLAHPSRTQHINASQLRHITNFITPDAFTCLLLLSLVPGYNKMHLEIFSHQGGSAGTSILKLTTCYGYVLNWKLRTIESQQLPTSFEL